MASRARRAEIATNPDVRTAGQTRAPVLRRRRLPSAQRNFYSSVMIEAKRNPKWSRWPICDQRHARSSRAFQRQRRRCGQRLSVVFSLGLQLTFFRKKFAVGRVRDPAPRVEETFRWSGGRGLGDWRVTGRCQPGRRSTNRAPGSQSRRNSDFARQTLGAPIEPHLPLRATSNHALDHIGAETPTRRWIDRRTSRLGPAQYELSIC